MNIYKVIIPGEHKSEDWADNQSSPTTYPGTWKVTATPKGGGITPRISLAHWIFNRETNAYMGTLEGWEKLRKMWSGWLNSASNPEWEPGTTLPDPPDPLPKTETLVTVNNYVNVLEIKNGSARIEIADSKKAPPNITPVSHPWLFEEMHSVTGGYAPEGKRSYTLRIAPDGIGWVNMDYLEKAELPDNLYKREVTVENDFFDGTFSTMLDMSHAWSGVHKDDGIDDGDEFDEDIVIFKVIHGLHHYTDPSSPYYEQAKKQRDSVDDTNIKGGYGWIVPELNGAEQVRDLANIVYGLGFSIAAVDLEERVNDKIIGEVIAGMKKYSVIYPRLHFWLYLNWSTYTMVKAYCHNHNLMDWFNGLHYNVNTGRGYLWVAGGPVYQQKIDFSDLDGLDPFPMAIAMQLSTDKNELSDEVDYELDRLSESQNERLSIDVNKVRISPNKLWKYFDKGEAWEKRRIERPVEVQPKMTLKEFVAFIKAKARGLLK